MRQALGGNRGTLLMGVVAAGLMFAGAGLQGAAAQDAVSIGTTESAGNTYLVDGNGMPLYTFDFDTRMSGDTAAVSKCSGPCAAIWVPLVGAAQAGDGVDAGMIGSFDREDGGTQVLYNGWPLYVGQPQSGSGQNPRAGWYLIQPNGERLRITG